MPTLMVVRVELERHSGDSCDIKYMQPAPPDTSKVYSGNSVASGSIRSGGLTSEKDRNIEAQE